AERCDRSNGSQRDVVVEHRGIIGHGVALLVWNTRRLHRQRGPARKVPFRPSEVPTRSSADDRLLVGEAPSCGGSPRERARSEAEQRLAAGGAAPPTRTSAV